MEKVTTDSKHLNALRMLDDFLRAKGLSLSEPTGLDRFLKELSEILPKHKANTALLHGFRAQTMFAYFAAALGGCKIINEEDSGEFYLAAQGFKRPDFRLLPHSGQDFFVEVKNFHRSDTEAPYVLQSEYATCLQNYADAFQKPLLFAIYWARWQNWTLTPLAAFSRVGETYSISLPEAIKHDQKRLLGDCLIGIAKPLALRLYTDPAHPRKLTPSGQVQFTVQRAAFYAAGREITDKFEKRLAWFFLRYAQWEDIQQIPHIEGGEVICMEFRGEREDPNPQQAFLMVGPLSQMISRQFNELTVEEGKIHHLSPAIQPGKLGVLIPAGFVGDVLGIWRFTVQPDQPVVGPIQ